MLRLNPFACFEASKCSIPSHGGVFQGFFSLADHTLPTRPELAWQKMAQSPLNDTTQPVDSEEEGQSSTVDRRWLN